MGALYNEIDNFAADWISELVIRRIMKLIIAGSRNLHITTADICLALEYFHTPMPTEVVSGGARGVDAIGEEYSLKYLNKPARIFPADWDHYGRGAGPIRNEQMASYADAALLFFGDSPTPGTSNMMAWMEMKRKRSLVVTAKHMDQGWWIDRRIELMR